MVARITLPRALAPVLALLLALPAAAAPPDVDWTAAFGHPGMDEGWAVAPTTDGGWVLAGSADPDGNGVKDVYLVKIGAAGQPQWQRTYGGAAHDVARAVLQATDGGYVLAGDTGVWPDLYDLLVIRTDAAGDVLWQTTVGGPGRETGRGLCAAPGGDVVVVGDSVTDAAGTQFYAVRLDPDGTVAWERRVGGGDDHLYAVQPTADGGFAVCGYSGDGGTFPEFDARVLKLTAGGGPQWQRAFDATIDDRAHAVRVLPDGDIVVAGIANGRATLRRLNPLGAARWERTYPADSGQAFALAVLPDGSFCLAGTEWAYDDGAYQMSIVRTDAAGALMGSLLVGGADWEYGRGLAVQPNGRLVAVGDTRSEGAGGYDLYAVGLDAGALAAVGDPAPGARAVLQAAPNPFNPRLQVSFAPAVDGPALVRVFDLHGRHVATLHDGPVAAGTHTVTWNGRDASGRGLPTGTYLVELRGPGSRAVRKVTLLR